MLSVCCPRFAGSTPLIFRRSPNPGKGRSSELIWPTVQDIQHNRFYFVITYRLMYEQPGEGLLVPSLPFFCRGIRGSRSGPVNAVYGMVWWGQQLPRVCITISNREERD